MEEKAINTFTKRVLICSDHRIRLDLDIPADSPEGEAEATVKIRPLACEKKDTNRLREIRGKGEGRFWMPDDFDEPLEDFAEYTSCGFCSTPTPYCGTCMPLRESVGQRELP